MKSATREKPLLLVSAFLFSWVVPIYGYTYLGPLVAALFLVGYFGGFVLWVSVPTSVSWKRIQIPYWVTFAIFIFLHKVEENRMKFFEVLGKKITGVPVPQMSLTLVITLLILPMLTWLLIPFLVKRVHPLGYYLAWTFFLSFGVTEAAHFIFPLMTNEPYRYFPGMTSAALLVPVGIWGLLRMRAR